MAKSKAKKMREKLIREGNRNPSLNRGVYVMVDMKTRKTKTKQGKINQQKHKKRLSDAHSYESDTAFLYVR